MGAGGDSAADGNRTTPRSPSRVKDGERGFSWTSLAQIPLAFFPIGPTWWSNVSLITLRSSGGTLLRMHADSARGKSLPRASLAQRASPGAPGPRRDDAGPFLTSECLAKVAGGLEYAVHQRLGQPGVQASFQTKV